jgi:hypothetical protein
MGSANDSSALNADKEAMASGDDVFTKGQPMALGPIKPISQHCINW